MNDTFIKRLASQWGDTARMSDVRNKISKVERKTIDYQNSVVSSIIKNQPFNLKKAENNNKESLLHISLLRIKGEKIRQENSRDINVERQLESIRRNVFIESAVYHEDDNRFEVITRDIITTYKDLNNATQDVNMGKYRLIFRDRNKTPHVRSITNGYLQNSHPCISGGDICLGDYDDILKQSILALRFDLFVDTLIMFLRNLDTDNPYNNINNIINDMREHENPIANDNANASYAELI